MDGDPSGATVRFRRPNSMELDIKIPDRRVRIHIWCVPIAPLRTRMVLVAGRDFMLNNPFAFISNQFNRFIMLEDQAVVESSQPPEVPPPGDELSVASDGPTLAFRRYYYRDLRGSGGAVIPASRLSEPAINSWCSQRGTACGHHDPTAISPPKGGSALRSSSCAVSANTGRPLVVSNSSSSLIKGSRSHTHATPERA